MSTLSPTARTTATRSRHRMVAEREDLHALLADGIVAHLGVNVGDHPVVVPMAYGVDLEGPDDGGSLYLHGSVAAGWLDAAVGATVCVTVTEIDGLVLARSGFHHSMNYRTGVVIGTLRRVDDVQERARALDLVVDQIVPGRATTLRSPTRKELAATAVLAVALREASLKARSGGPQDEPADVAAGAWAGEVPIRRILDAPVDAVDSRAPVPADVRALVAAEPGGRGGAGGQ